MKRREFIAGLGGTAGWPLLVRAQQAERVRRIGVLTGYDENDSEGQLRYSVFTQALAELGWTDGRNVRMDFSDGGLLSYGFDQVDGWRRAATYVDRILRGVKPSELPVQFSTKFDLVINLKTARALGLTISPNLLAIADEVIE